MAEYMFDPIFGGDSLEESVLGPVVTFRSAVEPYMYEPPPKRKRAEEVQDESDDEESDAGEKENEDPDEIDLAGATDVSW